MRVFPDCPLLPLGPMAGLATMATEPAIGPPHSRSTATIRKPHPLSATSRQSTPFSESLYDPIKGWPRAIWDGGDGACPYRLRRRA